MWIAAPSRFAGCFRMWTEASDEDRSAFIDMARAALEALPVERSEPTEAMVEAGMDAAPGLLRHDREAVRKVLRAAMQAAVERSVALSEATTFANEYLPSGLRETAEWRALIVTLGGKP